MKNPWFRLYAEFAFDPKIQSMSETLQRRFVMLLCLKCNDDLRCITKDELCFALRIPEEELEKTKVSFIEKGFIDESWDIIKWNKRQYISDNSTERSRKHRALKKKASLQRCKSVSATAPDTDTDTDTDNKEKKKKEKFDPKKLCPLFMNQEDWNYILAHRKKYKGQNTERALKTVIKELKLTFYSNINLTKAIDEFSTTTWTGYKHEWIENRLRKAPKPSQNFTPRQKYMQTLLKETREELGGQNDDFKAGSMEGIKETKFSLS